VQYRSLPNLPAAWRAKTRPLPRGTESQGITPAGGGWRAVHTPLAPTHCPSRSLAVGSCRQRAAPTRACTEVLHLTPGCACVRVFCRCRSVFSKSKATENRATCSTGVFSSVRLHCSQVISGVYSSRTHITAHSNNPIEYNTFRSCVGQAIQSLPNEHLAPACRTSDCYPPKRTPLGLSNRSGCGSTAPHRCRGPGRS